MTIKTKNKNKIFLAVIPLAMILLFLIAVLLKINNQNDDEKIVELEETKENNEKINKITSSTYDYSSLLIIFISMIIVGVFLKPFRSSR